VNSMGRFWCVIIIFLLCGSAIAGDKTNAYQKGTITEGLSATHKFYELKDGAHGYRFNGCGDFQAGQVVDYRLESDKLHIRRENGAEDKCAIKGRMTFDEPSPPVAEPTAPANYVKGIIQGYEELYRELHPSRETRKLGTVILPERIVNRGVGCGARGRSAPSPHAAM